MTKEPNQWMSAPEAANRLGLSISTVRRLALAGWVYRRDRGARRYYIPSVEAYRRGIRQPNQWAMEHAAS